MWEAPLDSTLDLNKDKGFTDLLDFSANDMYMILLINFKNFGFFKKLKLQILNRAFFEFCNRLFIINAKSNWNEFRSRKTLCFGFCFFL